MTCIRILISLVLLTWMSPAYAQIVPLGERLSKLKTNTQPTPPSPESSAPQTPPLSALKPTLAAPSATVQKPSKFSHLPIGKFDIAGVRVGMSPEQVSQILKSKGYEQTGTGRGPSFDEAVKVKKGLISKEDAMSAVIGRRFVKGYESIDLVFLSFPPGSQLFTVEYVNKDPGLTVDSFNDLVKDKYGWPDKPTPSPLVRKKWSKKLLKGDQVGSDETLSSRARREKKQVSLVAPFAMIKTLDELIHAQIASAQTTF